MKLITAAALLGLCLPAPAVAQAKPPYASCAWWQSLKADAGNELFLIGYAQGLVVGAVAYPLPDTPMDAHRALFEVYQKGQEQLLQRPSLVQDYIDVKCADAKNAAVRVFALSMLATFEKGGLPPARIEAALRLNRNDFAVKRDVVLAALAGR
jgi:hypothetical protein